MKVLGLRPAATFAAVAFAGCAAARQSAVPPSEPPQAATVPPASQRVSWMGKGLEHQDLLYVSNQDGVVNVYRYWQHTFVAS